LRLLPSLRSRLLSGAVLWTVGLFIGALLLSVAVIDRNPRVPYYLHSHAIYQRTELIVGAVVFMLVGFWVVRRGLAPFGHLRSQLSGVHAGSARRVEGAYPAEVQPLVDDLNALIEQRELAVRRALAKAGDLAHGLKTPLAILAREAERATAAGQTELAAGIAEQVERMRRQIDYHLAHARAAASGAATGATCAVADSIRPLVRTMLRLRAEPGLTIDDRVPPDHVVRCQREDLDEILGNLLDNACKWARSRVVVESAKRDGQIAISVDDDGPGLAPAMRERVLRRGVRADEAAPGSGLGLAIVRDLADLYGGSIALEDSVLGGVRAVVMLQRAGDGAAR
jgi:signal transduction histidine kinase